MPNKKSAKPLVISLVKDQQYDAFGDAANAIVLQKRASWSGNEAEIKLLGTTDTVGDFLVIAGGTDSSYENFAKQIEELKPEIEKALKAGIPTLVTGTAIKALIDSGIVTGHTYKAANHSADDQVTDVGEVIGKVTGFVNTRWEYSFGSLAVFDNLVLTQFAGPVLARNPKLADWMLQKAGLEKGNHEHLAQADELAQKIVSRILNV